MLRRWLVAARERLFHTQEFDRRLRELESLARGQRLSLADRFTEVYERNLWGDSQSFSGPGSRIESAPVREALDALERVIAAYGIRSIVDVPCGDFNWMPAFLVNHPDIDYIGLDIVAPLIARNSAKFPACKFAVLDLTKAIPPTADLIFCKDLFAHLIELDVFACLQNIRRSGATYFLASNNFGYKNTELPHNKGGTNRHLDLAAPPYRLPAPMWRSDYFGVWEVAALPS
jgi:hypothetical protein